MGTTNYDKTYIKCYELVMDLTKEIKDFFYPGQYSFTRFDKNMTYSKKLEVIRKDLESVKFQKEVPSGLFKHLEAYYPIEKVANDDVLNDHLSFLFHANLQKIIDLVKDKYLPFIKTMSIKEYREELLEKRMSDEEIWEKLLSDREKVKVMESRVNDIVWAIIDRSKFDIVDGFLMQQYRLSEIEYKRYLNGEVNDFSSIINNSDDSVKLNVNFNKFNDYFGDIIGQDDSLNLIRRVLLRNIMFYNAKCVDQSIVERQKGPLATFMFYGPTGTGKTEVSKRMAEFVYGGEDKLLILDMNAYKDPKISASAIKGHPEGYVDSNKGTDFTRFLDKHEHGIIVLDEFEKSTGEVREIFMTMLDEGKFKDSLGKVYDLSGYIFIATTNISKVFEQKKPQIGFGNADTIESKRMEEIEIKDKLREIFTSPIMNRFNNIVGFEKISRSAGAVICENLINNLVKNFENRNFNGIRPKVKISNIDKLVEYILNESNFSKDGVRTLKNNVNDIVGSLILEEIVKGNKNIKISADNNGVIVEKRNTSKRAH